MMRPLIEVQNLTKHFVIERSWSGQPLKTVQAVTQVSFSIPPGETLGLVGETGCGKSTVGRTLAGLYEPSGGAAFLDGIDIHAALRSLGKDELDKVRHLFLRHIASPYAKRHNRSGVQTGNDARFAKASTENVFPIFIAKHLPEPWQLIRDLFKQAPHQPVLID